MSGISSLKESICRALEEQLKQEPQDGESTPIINDGESPIEGWLEESPELCGNLVATIKQQLTHQPAQMHQLESDLNATCALLTEFSGCVKKAKTDIEFALTMIKSAAATLDVVGMEKSGSSSGSMAEQPEMSE